jgi:hypothetical protein
MKSLVTTLVFAGALALAVVISPPASASTQGSDYLVAQSIPISLSGGTAQVLTGIELELAVCTDLNHPCVGAPNIQGPLDFELAPSDIGLTFWKDSSDPNFATFVQFITNGLPDVIARSIPAGTHADLEPTFLGAQVGPNGIDLAGYDIRQIGFRVDGLSLVSPGQDPNGDGIWTDISVEGVFLFAGAGKDDCKGGGWMRLKRLDGSAFKDQGDCIQYGETGK